MHRVPSPHRVTCHSSLMFVVVQPQGAAVDRQQAKDNRARRKRAASTQMRELLVRVAALGASTDESEPCGKAHACVVCSSLFECDPGCVVGDARRWLAAHRQDGAR